MKPLAGGTSDARALTISAAAMYVFAGLLGIADNLTPGGPHFAWTPSIGAIVVGLALVPLGPRVPRRRWLWLAPVGIVGLAANLASIRGATDGAILYALPVMWVAHFYGRRATAAVLALLAVAHGVALASIGPSGYFDRWLDVVTTAALLAVATRILTERILRLVEVQHAQARTDALTGLANRRAFDERHGTEIARAERFGDPLSVVIFDIDHFKTVNDRFGHAVGDEVIARVGAALRDETRGTDVVARIGGEEFAVALPGADLAAATAFAHRVRARVATDPREPHVRLSAGVASTTAGIAAPVLLEQADAALYAAKRAGRDRVEHAAAPRPAGV